MPYVGRGTDKLSNVEVLDNITFDGSSSYTLQKGGSNFTPSSANTLLVSIDGVVQAGNFTVSGSTINFGTAVSASSTCDFILHYGTGLITTPADGTVTTAKLADSSVTTAKLNDASVSLAKLTATGTKDATTFLRGDNTFQTVSSYTDSDALSLFNASGSAPVYACRAWVNFNGSGTVAIRGSGNVTSITDDGTGKYTINFTTAMPDDDYCVTVNHAEDGGGAYSNFGAGSRVSAFNVNPDRTTTSFAIATEVANSGFTDMVTIEAIVVR